MIDQAVAYLIETLSANEFFQGGFILALFGTLAVWGKSLPSKVWDITKRLLIVECDVQQRDAAFPALVTWLATQPYGKRVKRFSVSIREDEDGSYHTVFSPAPGVHWLWYGRRLIRFERGREKLAMNGGNSIVGFYESFTLQTFGRGRDSLEKVIKAAIKMHTDKNDEGVSVSVQDGYGGWDEISKLPTRSMESIILDDRIAEKTLKDMEDFLSAEQWYTSLGIPYRRGYLFYGPPGTGKSSFCVALASQLGFGLSVITLSDRKLTDIHLAKMLARTRKRSLLLLEDVDCLFDEDRTTKDPEAGITLSGLLNALDGAQAQTGRMIVMTTNYSDSLDPALVRPGRADMKIEFKLASISQIERLFHRFFPEKSSRAATDFVESVGDGKKSVAEIQGRLMKRISEEKASG